MIGVSLPATWRETVRGEWCDYNGHLNMAYYVLIFDHATDAFHDSGKGGSDAIMVHGAFKLG